MAGHSAWKNIKHRKAAVDAKRGKLWSKASRAIIVAARTGGADPRFNASLRMAIDEARSVNMPRDTIEKAVKKGSGALEGEEYQAIRYEGYGPGGVALVVECLTSNINRTAPEVRTLFDKHGGNLGVNGSVSHSFRQCGVVILPRETLSEERVMEIGLDAGADDVVGHEDVWQLTCPAPTLAALRDAFEGAGIAFEQAQVLWLPQVEVAVDAVLGERIRALIDGLEELDDVQKVYANAVFPD